MLPQSSLFPRPFLVIGHRGAAGIEPENTLRSFRRALDLGVDALELDVYRVEGDLVVIHDGTVNRTTNGSGAVERLGLAALRALDAGAGESIPLLDEVLDLAAGSRTLVNVELKGKGTGRAVAERLDASTHVLVSSFDHDELRAFRELRADVAVAPLFGRWHDDAIAIADDLDAVAINLGNRIVKRDRVEKIRAAGYRALVYTVNRVARARALEAMGVSGVFTDRPDRLVPAFMRPAAERV